MEALPVHLTTDMEALPVHLTTDREALPVHFTTDREALPVHLTRSHQNQTESDVVSSFLLPTPKDENCQQLHPRSLHLLSK